MELRRPDPALLDRGHDGAPVVGGGRDDGLAVGHRRVGVDEVEPTAVVNALEELRARPDREGVPPHVGQPLAGDGEAADLAGDDPEALHTGGLLAGVEQHLHPDADADERLAGLHRVVDHRLQPRFAQLLHTAAEGTDAGQDDTGRLPGHGRVGGQGGVGTEVLEGLLGRAEVADPVVENGDHSTSLVDGIPPPSTRTASRSARATPLNEASRTWWPLRPVRLFRCSVMPAEVTKARKNSSASWGSKVPIRSGAVSTSYTRNGRPDRSSATWISASSSGRRYEAKRR